MKMCMIGNRGHWRYVFSNLSSIPELTITGVSSGCEDDVTMLKEHCQSHGFNVTTYADYLEMLDVEKPNIVCVDGPFELHATMSIAALERNINVFCEKPIALSLDDLYKVETAYQKSSAKIFSMIGLRYEAPFQKALKLVKQGVIGKVKLISTRKSYKLGKRPDFYCHRASYGGTIPWVGSHALDWIMSFANSDFKQVFALQSSSDNFGHGDLEIAAECQFEMTNGVIAQASIDFLRPGSASTHGDDRVRVGGTTGVIEVSNGIIHLINADGEQEMPAKVSRSLFSDIVLDIMGKGQALTTPEETIALTKACLLTQESADSGKLLSFDQY